MRRRPRPPYPKRPETAHGGQPFVHVREETLKPTLRPSPLHAGEQRRIPAAQFTISITILAPSLIREDDDAVSPYLLLSFCSVASQAMGGLAGILPELALTV